MLGRIDSEASNAHPWLTEAEVMVVDFFGFFVYRAKINKGDEMVFWGGLLNKGDEIDEILPKSMWG